MAINEIVDKTRSIFEKYKFLKVDMYDDHGTLGFLINDGFCDLSLMQIGSLLMDLKEVLHQYVDISTSLTDDIKKLKRVTVYAA